MGTKHVVWGSLFLLGFCTATATFADAITGSGGASFQIWSASQLNHNGKPYWDNKSLDGTNKTQKNTSNVGFYLTGSEDNPAYTLEDGPDSLLPMPYWGKSIKNSKKKTGGNADLSFYFDGSDRLSLTNPSAPTLKAELNLEATPAATADVDEFGWYDISNPLDLHPIFVGSDSPGAEDMFSPSPQYGFYLKRRGQPTFYTQSSLNPYKDTSHQHFVVFEESATSGAEIYWIGIENSTRLELNGKEGGLGDYNDMLIRITSLSSPLPVPEPSAAVLVLSGTSFILVLLERRRK
ncbi:MAG TPA: hypothetical protein VL486_15370 [Verrucomicrobiae bacterium]|nr:hypothetical protein [Verrucomicrobiae bacterium]